MKFAAHKLAEKIISSVTGIRFCNGCDHDIPYKFEIDLTNNCHNNCKFCYYAASLSKEKCIPNVEKICKNVIELHMEYSKIFMKKYGLEYKPMLYILGGEPLLYINECYDIVKRLSNLFSSVLIISALPPTVNDHYDTFKKLLLIKNVNIDFSLLHSDEKLANILRNVPDRKLYVNNTICKILNDKDLTDVTVGARIVLDPNTFKTSNDISKCIIGFEKLCESTLRKFTYLRFTELDDTPVDVHSLFNISSKLKSAYSNCCTYNLNYGSIIPIILKRKCFRECREKRMVESFSDIIKYVYKIFRIALNKWQPYWIPMPIIKYDGRITNYREERSLRKKVCRTSR